MTKEAQEQLLSLEIAIQDSRWAIASSQRLLEKTAALRARLNPQREGEPA